LAPHTEELIAEGTAGKIDMARIVALVANVSRDEVVKGRSQR
jgi:hypothetical protein